MDILNRTMPPDTPPPSGGNSKKDTDMEKSGNKSTHKTTVAPTQGSKGKPAEAAPHASGGHVDKHDKDTNAKHAQKK